MTAGDHEMPPHLARYLESLGGPAEVTERPHLTVTPGYDVGQYLEGRQEPVPDAARARPAEAGQETGHVDPAAAGRWHQAQTELVELIRAEGRTLAADPEAAAVLPDELGPWMEQRVAELADPEIG
jgi:hypothetical protein